MAGNKSDTIIGIIGAVAIVAALVGVFVYEYNNVDTDDGTGIDPPVASEQFDGSIGQGESGTATFNPAEGVTDITLVISWTPTAPSVLGPATGYSFTISGPDGYANSGSSTSGQTISIVPAVAGEYTLTITADGSSLGGDWVAETSYDY